MPVSTTLAISEGAVEALVTAGVELRVRNRLPSRLQRRSHDLSTLLAALARAPLTRPVDQGSTMRWRVAAVLSTALSVSILSSVTISTRLRQGDFRLVTETTQPILKYSICASCCIHRGYHLIRQGHDGCDEGPATACASYVYWFVWSRVQGLGVKPGPAGQTEALSPQRTEA